MRNSDRAFRAGAVCKSQDFDLNFSYNDWSGMDSLVISTQLSILMRKNQELAMQISLLNRDSERMMKKLEELEKRIDQHFAGGDDLQK